MSRLSVKRRLILAFQRELEDAVDENERVELAHYIWKLGQRGSGALPAWARRAALRRGIT